ncbi:MAG: hypothetical protein VKO44_01055 [Cyanobacteriota bacterium]|nr:hypothetical protein [Cyanobacteriota bacterium]
MSHPRAALRSVPAIAMAARNSLNAKNLEGLGAARLAALLMEISEGNAAARRTLRLALAESQGPVELAQEVRKRLAAVDRSSRWLDTRDRDALLIDLERQRQVILGAIASKAPALAVELLWRFLELGTSVRDRCEDVDDRTLRFFQALSADLGGLAPLAGLAPAALADQVAELAMSTHMGQYNLLIVHLAPALGTEGLLRLRARIEEMRPATAAPRPYWVEEDQPDPGGEDEAEEAGVCTHSDVYNVYGFHNPEWDDDDGDDEPVETMRIEPWIGDFEPEFPTPEAIDRDPAVRHQRVRLAMLAIADGLNDAEAYWAEYRDHLPAALCRPRLAARVARRLTAAGQPERALAVLEAVPLRRGLRSDGYRRWLDAHLAALEALGRQEEAQRLRLAFALDRLSLTHLRDYLRRLPAFEDEPALEKALDQVLRHPNAPAALAFLHRWPDRRRTARLILARPHQLHGGDEPLLEGIVSALEGSQPLAATLCLRLLVEFILETGQANRYGRAVRHLDSCRRLAAAIDDWRRIPRHNSYVRDLLRDFEHRKGFLNKLDYDQLLVDEPRR